MVPQKPAKLKKFLNIILSILLGTFAGLGSVDISLLDRYLLQFF